MARSAAGVRASTSAACSTSKSIARPSRRSRPILTYGATRPSYASSGRSRLASRSQSWPGSTPDSVLDEPDRRPHRAFVPLPPPWRPRLQHDWITVARAEGTERGGGFVESGPPSRARSRRVASRRARGTRSAGDHGRQRAAFRPTASRCALAPITLGSRSSAAATCRMSRRRAGSAHWRSKSPTIQAGPSTPYTATCSNPAASTSSRSSSG